MAELRKQALLASGVQIEGLQQQASGSGPPAPKKVVYGNRKKKGPATKDESPAPSRPRSPEPVQEVKATPSPVNDTQEKTGDAKSDWDASSDEEEPAQPLAPAPPSVKDDWDASSEEDEKKKPSKSQNSIEISYLH